MNDAQRRITVLHTVHNDADCKNIVNLIQRFMLVDHFLINTEEVLDPSADLALNVRVFHVAFDFTDDIINEALPCLAGQGNLFFQLLIYIRLQIF